jgi:hypothetical protein
LIVRSGRTLAARERVPKLAKSIQGSVRWKEVTSASGCQLLLGLAAAGLTYGIGHLVGVSFFGGVWPRGNEPGYRRCRFGLDYPESAPIRLVL